MLFECGNMPMVDVMTLLYNLVLFVLGSACAKWALGLYFVCLWPMRRVG